VPFFRLAAKCQKLAISLHFFWGNTPGDFPDFSKLTSFISSPWDSRELYYADWFDHHYMTSYNARVCHLFKSTSFIVTFAALIPLSGGLPCLILVCICWLRCRKGVIIFFYCKVMFGYPKVLLVQINGMFIVQLSKTQVEFAYFWLNIQNGVCKTIFFICVFEWLLKIIYWAWQRNITFILFLHL
jgi:hypothetical protein